MKANISLFMLLMGRLLGSATSVAACNADIDISKPDSFYTDHLDGTVTDKQTGLMWQKCSLGLSGNTCGAGAAFTLTWQAALVAAKDNTDYQYSDWRLPNIRELASLLENACFWPVINASVFPNTVTSSYWSSSPYAGLNDVAWYTVFGNGYVGVGSKNGTRYVRLVRGSQ